MTWKQLLAFIFGGVLPWIWWSTEACDAEGNPDGAVLSHEAEFLHVGWLGVGVALVAANIRLRWE